MATDRGSSGKNRRAVLLRRFPVQAFMAPFPGSTEINPQTVLLLSGAVLL